MKQTLIQGDAREALKDLPDASVQLIVTSPPYGSLKDYGDHPDQIGVEQAYPEYLESLRRVWLECARVLEPGCRIAVNVGDQFLRARDHGEYSVVPIHADILQQLRELGLTCFGNILWRKITTTKTTGGCTWMGSIYYPRDGHITYEHEYILLFRKSGKARRPSKEIREQSRLTKEQRSAWFRGFWEIAPVRQEEHPAAFPLELPERLIRMYTFVGETILDPFVGSGTTLQAAEGAERHGIGIELNATFCKMASGRIKREILPRVF